MDNEKGVTTTQEALPATFEELSGMAKAFVASGMFQDTKQLSQAIVKIQAGRELGLPPVYSMQNINMIRDKLTSSANTLAMLVKKSGRYNYRIKEHDEQTCKITFYEQDNGKWVEVGDSTFTMADAKRAELVKPGGGWVKYPRAMLFSRAISQGARIYAPDAIGGIYTDEEIGSIPPRTSDDNPNEIDTRGENEKEGIDVVAEVTEKVSAKKQELSPPVTEQVLHPGAEKEAAQVSDQPLQDGFIDLGWLKEQLDILQGAKLEGCTNAAIIKYLNTITGKKAIRVSDAVKELTKEQAVQFTKKVTEAVSMA